MTLIELLAKRTAEAPRRTFLTFEGKDYTLEELDRRSTRVAARLAKLGVGKGDTVAVLMENRPEYVLAWFGILKAGAAPVPINPQLTPAEVEYIRTNSESRLVVTAKDFEHGFEDEPGALPAVADDDLAAIVYTSGTTGKPKGAMLTH